MDKEPQAKGGKRPGALGAGTITTLPRPIPAWDITDEEISEWQHSRSGTPGMVLAGYTAAAIRDGRYSGGELFPPGSQAYREVTRQTVDKAMQMLAERGMVRKSGNAWYPVTPGRIAPSTRRAITILLASREQLPPALATELDAYNAALDTMHPDAPGGRSASQAATERATRPVQPARAIVAG
jgi:hypothetical protein